LAVLPPTDHDLTLYREMLAASRNHVRNLVAEVDGRVVGTVTYDRSDEDVGEIGVFVDDELDGTGVGDVLLGSLIAATTESLEVAIFARNPSREFYRRHGFREYGPEFEHRFREGVSLPVQRLRLTR
jgi:N-acetylglutamate synthase-like GNAT family acetyltransferase